MSRLEASSISAGRSDRRGAGAGYVMVNSEADSPDPMAFVNVSLPVCAIAGTVMRIHLSLTRCEIVAASPPMVALTTLLSASPVTVISQPAYPSAGEKVVTTGAVSMNSFIDSLSHAPYTNMEATARIELIY